MVEAMAPMELKVSGQVKILKPGDRLNLPEDKARKLLRLAGGKVRLIPENPNFQPGMWCEWFSPLFGPCTGQIKEVTVSGYIVTKHSVLGPEGAVTIPAEWIVDIKQFP